MPSGRTNNFPRKWAWPRSRDPTIFGIRSNISPKLLELATPNLVHGFVLGMRAGAQIIFPKCGRGLGHVTPTILGSTVGYPSDSLASCKTYLLTYLLTCVRIEPVRVQQWRLSVPVSAYV